MQLARVTEAIPEIAGVENDEKSAKVCCFANPIRSALSVLIIPVCLVVIPLLIPLSGSYSHSGDPSVVNVWVYSLIWEPIYIYWSFWVVQSFYLFSTRRFSNRWWYFILSLVSFTCSVTYCLANGAKGLDRNYYVSIWSTIWTSGFVIPVQLVAALHWQANHPTDATPTSPSSSSSDIISTSESSLLSHKGHFVPFSSAPPTLSCDNQPVNISSPSVSPMLASAPGPSDASSFERVVPLLLNSTGDVSPPSSASIHPSPNENSPPPSPQQCDSYFVQFLYSTASCAVLVATFTFLQTLLSLFIKQTNQSDQQTGFYLLFQAATFVFRQIAWILARLQRARSPSADKHIVSLFLFSQHCFFFIFYRSLFAHINSIGEFALFQFIQMVLELMQYVVMMEEHIYRLHRPLWLHCYHGCLSRLRACLSCRWRLEEEDYVAYLRQRTPEAVEQDWHKDVNDKSRDFLVRLIAMTGPWLCLLAVSIMILQVPFVEPHFRTLINQNGPSFTTTQIYFVISIVCEWGVAVMIDWFLRRRRQRGESLWSMWVQLSANPEMLMVFIIQLAHITHDVYVPALCMNFLDQNPACSHP